MFSAASFGFTGNASIVPMMDFLLGKVQTMTQGTPNTVFTYKWYYGLYGQDTWKVSRRLTANSLRWELFLPQGLNNGAKQLQHGSFSKGQRHPLRMPGRASLRR